jgi:hypothetical protein
MATSSYDRFRLRFGTPVRIKPGLVRKPWEWIGHIQQISGDIACVSWRVVLPGTGGKRPITNRNLNDLEVLDGIGPSSGDELQAQS